MKFTHVLGAAALSFSVVLSSTAFAADVTGAGASFPAPVYQAWGAAYKAKSGVGLNYQSIGSGGGQNQIVNRTVDFGASDAPMKDDKLEAANLLQFPTVIGSVVAITNLDGVEGLVLDGAVLADIYQGKITKWNDPKIAALNKGKTLPDLAIVPVYRSDSSGTSFVFTSYLASTSADWKSNVGAATSVQWPAGAGAKGNEGIAGTVKNTKGAVGYVEFIYAAANNLAAADLVNKAGTVVKPTTAAFMEAASAADWKGAKNFAASMIDTAGAGAWPITSPTYILLPKNPTSAAQSAEAIKFFDWAYGAEGDAIAEKLHYIPLPDSVVADIKKAWAAEVKADGKPVWGN